MENYYLLIVMINLPLLLQLILHACVRFPSGHSALTRTIKIQAEIDEIYPNVEKDVIEFYFNTIRRFSGFQEVINGL